MEKKIIFITLGIIAAAAITGAIVKNRQKMTEVEIDTVKNITLIQTVSASGVIEAVREVKLSSSVSAQIEKLNVKAGQKINAGDLLVVLDRKNLEQQLKQQEAYLSQRKLAARSAQSQLKQAELDYKQAKEMFDKKLLAETEYTRLKIALDIAKDTYDSSIESIKSSEASLAEMREQLRKTDLYAPIGGTVSKLYKEAGEMALGSQFNTDVILSIADLNILLVKVDVDENDIAGVNIGDSAKVTVDAFPDSIFKGVVEEVANAPGKSTATQEQTVSYQVKIRLINPSNQIRSGMTSSADIITAVHKNITAVPLTALTRRKIDNKKSDQPADNIWADEKEYEDVLFLLKKEGDKAQVLKKPVKTGLANNRYIQILSGVNAKDEIVSGSYNTLSKVLENEMIVKVTEGKKNGEKK